MAKQTAYMIGGDHIIGIGQRFPLGSVVEYDDVTMSVLRVTPLGEPAPSVEAHNDDTTHTAQPTEDNTPSVVLPVQTTYGG